VIDWSDEASLNNWMTQLDLICEEPYKIGLIGAVYFISFSLGSLMFTGIIDYKGRKNMILAANLTHIICLVALVCFADSLNKIYGIIFTTGLAYSTRASGSYLYGSEFLVKD
jgi:MFS family permease